ncbi:diguanylate cyclase [Nitrosomonas sp. Is35]|uniref:diguanylate cyclase n=1 Tax=unclassified Nitrosomonas TaxID=2609265 RepID=UPI00294B683F|nr:MULTISPECIES: diguanylate cyclase [unclassified Nitrosomonas]MDV6340540.1 diguanylate cyclase [Nitrosomonas sp. Is24]MDV6346296.1 diguanylate cyclase [Nitrosomonas sp. Is35]
MKKNDRILALRKAAEAMARGDFAPDIPIGDDDIGNLGKSLKELSAYLQKQSERSQSLYKIMVECNFNLQLIDVLNHIYESFQTHLPYDRISLALLESDRNKLKLHWSRASYDKPELISGLSIPMTDRSLHTLIDLNEMLIIDDLNTHLQRYAESRLAQAIFKEGIRSCLICPLIADGKPIGFLFFSCRKKNAYKNLHKDLSLQIASQLAVIIEKTQLYKGIKLNKQLIAQKKSLEQRVTHDALTGLLNRPAIFDILHKQILRAKRGGFGIAVIMIDIDHFKNINDTCGHPAGDAVLCEIANRLTQSARSHEYIGRYGGEEFLAIISPFSQEGAVKAAERFRKAIASEEINTNQTLIPVTISLGVAIATGEESLDEHLLLQRADDALYQAKHKGRNRVEVARTDR